MTLESSVIGDFNLLWILRKRKEVKRHILLWVSRRKGRSKACSGLKINETSQAEVKISKNVAD